MIENLLGNAIKYRRPDMEPRIKFSAEKGDSEWIFSVDKGSTFFFTIPIRE